MIYRKASIEDAPQLAGLRWDFRHFHDGTDDDPPKEEFCRETAAWFEEMLQSKDWTVWVAVEGDLIVCQVYIQHIRKIPRPARIEDYFGYVTNVYTRPEWRKQGIGAQLIQRVKAWAREIDLEFLVLWSAEGSVEFYTREGFVNDSLTLQYVVRG